MIAIGDTGSFSGDQGLIELYYKNSGSSLWEKAGEVQNPKNIPGSDFGVTICVSLDGSTVLSSAPAVISETGYWTGEIFQFALEYSSSSNGTTTITATLENSYQMKCFILMGFGDMNTVESLVVRPMVNDSLPMEMPL